MAKLSATSLATLALLFAVSAPAVAGPTQPPRTEVSVSRQHSYWLSQDFQRLVFWQAPTQGNARR